MIDGMSSKLVRGDVSCASALTVPMGLTGQMGSTTRAGLPQSVSAKNEKDTKESNESSGNSP
jgi:hypothetical protein